MKKQIKTKARSGERMRPEYDFTKGVRGSHAARYAAGTNVVVLAPDVANQFRTADEVNDTLRAVARLIERRKNRGKRRTGAPSALVSGRKQHYWKRKDANKSN